MENNTAPPSHPGADVQSPTTFTRQHLKRLVELGGAALEAEDRFIRGAVSARDILRRSRGRRPARFGIRRAENEHFYQYMIWRALLNEFEFTVEMERKARYDFVIWDCGASEARILAVGELKRWVSPDGDTELPGIVRDIGKVKRSGHPGFILIATAFEAGSLAKQLAYLCPRLGITAGDVLRHKFEFYFEDASRPQEFGLLGFMASDSGCGKTLPPTSMVRSPHAGLE